MPSLFDKPDSLSLDMAGVSSLLGGDDALATMIAIHVYGNRRWLGWYNTPGSFQIAMRLSSFARSASFYSISSINISPEPFHTRSVQVDPAALLELASCKGPKFNAAHSGTIIEATGYLAALFMKECAALGSDGRLVPGRWTHPVRTTIADLGPGPATSEVRLAWKTTFTPISISIPILISIGTCALSAIHNDWYASLRIFIGVAASGILCFVLGSADFVFTHPEPANGLLAGDGILSSDEDIVLLRGTEGAVNSITHGRFSLHLSSEGHYSLIRLSSVLYFIQGITQLLLVLQASPFGQSMFLASLAISALYNAWLASSDKNHSLGRILFERVLGNPTLTKYTFGSRTTAMVFALLVLQPQDPTELLNELLPDNSMVWRLWKATISEWLRRPDNQSFLLGGILGGLNEFTQQEKDLLELLYEDARAAYNGYRDYLRDNSQ